MSHQKRAILFVFSACVIFVITIFADVATTYAATPTHLFTTTPITTTSIWTKLGSPYIIHGSGFLQVNAPLTIEPGVVIKFWPNRTGGTAIGLEFANGGNLTANGTDTDPIIFTSIYDDSVAGDTNNDGATPPLRGDWSSLKFNHDNSVVSHIIVRYGGNNRVSIGSVETKNNSQLLMSDSVISDSAESGLFVSEPSSPHFTHLTIQNNTESGIYATVTSTASDITDSVINGNGHNALTISSSNSLMFRNTIFTNNTPQTVEIKGNTIAHDTIWQYLPDLTYVYWSPVKITVTPNITLTIEPGVNVKMPNKSGLFVQGMLHANGTPTSPILFTSYRDSTVGGDTAYSGPTLGVAGDWGGIYFDRTNSQTSTLSHITLGYGGVFADQFSGFTYAFVDRNFVAVNNSAVKLDHVTLDHGFETGIGLMGNSSLEFTSSTISHTPRGIDISSPNSLTITDNRFVSTSIFAASIIGTGTLDARHNWWGDDSGPVTSTNPTGVGGSIYGPIAYDPWVGKVIKFDPVIIIPGILGSAEKDGVWLIDPIFHAYDDLINTLESNGYTKGVDLFPFPYDWRDTNVATARLLELKIKKVKEICQCDKVDIVAHSMGGLVARQYIQSERYKHDIDQLIFLGTPHLGSPKSYLMWEAGDSELTTSDQFINFLMSKEAKHFGYSSLFDYVRNRPAYSVQELLPIFDYIRDNDSGLLRKYPTNPRNAFLENLYNSSSTLFTSGIRLTNIIGDIGSNTIRYIRVDPSFWVPLWEDGHPDRYQIPFFDGGLERGHGDGTVPIESANFVRNDLNIIKSEHVSLPTNAESLIFQKFTGKIATVLFNEGLNVDKKLLVVKLLSPVDMQIIAPDGKRIGKDFTTNQEVSEIDGAFYSGFQGDDEYVTIPNPIDGEYRVETQGTDNGGEYTVAIGYITDTTSTKQDFVGQTVPGLMTELHVYVDSSATNTFEIKPTDVTPPSITIISPTTSIFSRPLNLFIEVAATDTETGVQSHEVSFDGTILPNPSSIDLFYQTLGTHILTATATDRVGNSTSLQKIIQIVATPDGTISDIQQARILGWITDDSITNHLMNDVKRIITLEKRIDLIEEKLPGKPKVIRRVERMEKRIDRILCATLQWYLALAHNRGKVNDQAFHLIQNDIHWLLTNN